MDQNLHLLSSLMFASLMFASNDCFERLMPRYADTVTEVHR
ncbi:MAG: hypothetical protein ACKOE2_05515 [Actinomycetales bacterium]